MVELELVGHGTIDVDEKQYKKGGMDAELEIQKDLLESKEVERNIELRYYRNRMIVKILFALSLGIGLIIIINL